MADILTQLQTCLDQLTTQLYASLRYLSTHHALSAPDPTPDPFNPTHPFSAHPLEFPTPSNTNTPIDPNDPALVPFPAAQFLKDQRELARDLIVKEAQIEYLVERLPGVGSSEEEQEARIRELEGILRGVERERGEKRREMREVVGRLEGVVRGVGRRE